MRRALLVATTSALLAVLALLTPAPAAAEEVHPMTFPVVGDVTWTDTWQAPRSGGRVHEGQDLMGDKGQLLVAADDGTVRAVRKGGSLAGNSVDVLADDGWIYTYLHLNNDTPGTDDGAATDDQIFAPGIVEGARVVAGQALAYIGDSGNAEGTAPHVHFEMRDPSGAKVNPAPHLEAATHVDGGSGPTPAEPSPIPRIAGPDRVATSIEAAFAGWPDGSPQAVLAAGGRFDEALPAGVLAGARQAPLLLTTSTAGLEPSIATALDELGTTSVAVIGSVPAAVDDDLRAAGVTVERVGVQGNPTATAAAIGIEVGGAAGTAVLVNGSRFADGVAAAGLAAGRNWPVFLTTQSTVPQVSVDAWRSIGIRRMVIVGGTGVINDRIENVFLRQTGCVDKTPCEVERIAGADRYATSVAAATKSLELGDRTAADLLVGTGTAYADALTAGPLTARKAGLTVLVDGSGAGHDAASRSFLEAQRPNVQRVAILGGTGAVGAVADRAVQQALGLTAG